MKRSAAQIDEVLGRIAHHGLGGLNPDADPLRHLLERNPEGPLQFVNLLAYRETARYPDDHPMARQGLTGARAYALYGAVAVRHVTKRGGRLVALNDVEQLLIGQGEAWNQIAIMEYPDAEAFVDMVCDPDYTAALVHRDAGLAKTAVWVTRPLVPVSPSKPSG